MTELFHFIEQGSMLKTLTSSDFIKGSVGLLLKWQAHPYLTMKIFKRIAAFLKELSNDNEHCRELYSVELDSLVSQLVESLFIENADFATNMLAFHFNVHLHRSGPSHVLSEGYFSGLV
jgi:hypothetical protein